MGILNFLRVLWVELMDHEFSVGISNLFLHCSPLSPLLQELEDWKLHSPDSLARRFQFMPCQWNLVKDLIGDERQRVTLASVWRYEGFRRWQIGRFPSRFQVQKCKSTYLLLTDSFEVFSDFCTSWFWEILAAIFLIFTAPVHPTVS